MKNELWQLFLDTAAPYSLTVTSPRVISPLSKLSRPPMALSRLVFPQPEGPRMHTNPVSGRVKDTSFSTRFAPGDRRS